MERSLVVLAYDTAHKRVRSPAETAADKPVL